MEVKVKLLNEKARLPEFQSKESAGADVYAMHKDIVRPRNILFIKTGFALDIPKGYEVQVRPRSGLALKNGITVLNSPGTIDSDYKDEVGIILYNASKTPFNIEPGMRIAQLVLNKLPKAEYVEVKELDKTDDRGGGFGSTGE